MRVVKVDSARWSALIAPRAATIIAQMFHSRHNTRPVAIYRLRVCLLARSTCTQNGSAYAHTRSNTISLFAGFTATCVRTVHSCDIWFLSAFWSLRALLPHTKFLDVLIFSNAYFCSEHMKFFPTIFLFIIILALHFYTIYISPYSIIIYECEF